jgi:hypothetical protein
VKETTGFEHTTSDVERWMLVLNDYVEAVASTAGPGATGGTAEAVTSTLRAEGYTGVLGYLEWADTQPSRSNDSLDGYEPWFDMGDLDGKTSPIVCPQAMDTRRRFLRTDGDVVASNRFLLVRPNSGVDTDVLLGLLNSSLTKVVIESHGRITGGGAVNLSASDLRTLRVLDPDALSDEQASRVERGFDRLALGDGTGLDDVDEVVIEVLELAVGVDELQAIADTLKRTRRRKGREVDPLIRRLDELEGHVELAFGRDGTRRQGRSEFGE